MMALGAVLCSVFVLLSPALGSVIPEVDQRGLELGPDNVAVLVGETTTLNCVTDGVVNSNVRWIEYVTISGTGSIITDGTNMVPGHPNAARYELIYDGDRTYALKISNINLDDAGYYECVDSNAAPPSYVRFGAQLVVLAAEPNCTSLIPNDGFTIEGQYYTAECSVFFRASPGIAPLMTWTGPEPFAQGNLVTNNSVWSGIEFYITRDMAGQNWICKTNFTQTGFLGPDSAENAPTWQFTSPTNQAFVYWPPNNLVATPVQPSYEIGQTISCSADANPAADIKWQSLRTSEFWNSNQFTTREDMVGYQLMRCQANNTLRGVSYTRDYFLDVYVNALTTTPTTTPPTTTTTPPAQSNCGDLTGRWQSSDPDATLCLIVNHDDGSLDGMFRNASETFWLRVTGKTRQEDYSESAFVLIWPANAIGVTSFAVKCNNCYGKETMLATGISRRNKDSEFCASGDLVSQSPTYTFYRVENAWPCATTAFEMKENIAKHALLL